ncbi:MAG: hypothetical protein CVV42_14415 [Candidatus Riflebacteria bacterium HGW-Riflebacteria-2]|nr:MAG: hypothetical protein CVV42_14415 [Candidatus Riflebacteria bacterium HGW-Riflebacteria-2]
MNKDSKVLIKRRLSGRILVFSWLFLLVIPAFILNYTLERLFKITEETNAKIKQSRLSVEMEMFKKDVLIANYLDREIGNYLANVPEESLLDVAPGLAEDFTKKTGIVPCGLIIHGKDTAEIKSYYHEPPFKKLIGMIPKRLTLKYFISRNDQPFLKFYEKKNEVETKSLKGESAWDKLVKDVDGFWQSHFGLVAELPLVADKTSQSVSSKLGGTVYFYYHPVYSGKAADRRIKGGVLLLIRGAAISALQVVTKSQNSVDKEITRSLNYYPNEINDLRKIDLNHKLTSFGFDSEGIHLQTPIPESLAVQFIQRGGFYPIGLKEFRQSIPLLKVTLPVKKLEHPLKKHSALISMIIRCLCAFSLILALRIYFFGFEIRAGVRQKVVIGTLLVSFLPLTLLIAAYQTWSEFDQRLLQVEMENTMKSNSRVIRKKLASYIHRVEKLSMDVAGQIEEMPNATDAELEKFLQSSIDKSVAQALFLDRPWKEPISVYNEDNACGFITSRDEGFFRKMLAKISMNAGLFNSSFNEGAGDYSSSDLQFVDDSSAGALNSMLNSFGRLMDFQVFASLNSYSMAKIEWNVGNKPRYGSVTARFNRQRLIRGFVKEYLESPSLKSDYSKFSMETAFFTFDNSQEVAEVHSLTPSYEYAKMAKQLILACQVNASLMTDVDEIPVYVDYVSRFPMLIVTTAQRLQRKSSGLSFVLLIIYGFVLIIFIFNLFGRIYLEPVEKLTFLADRVSQGDFYAKKKIETGDEFEDLKGAFDSMLAGVIQKERLFQFVSEDVVSAVKSSDDQALQPGGERLEATIIFASISDFEQRIALLSGTGLMDLLDIFISAGDKVARATGGILDKVIENTLMFVYRSRSEKDNHAIKACYAALELKKELLEVGITAHIGIATGSVLSGRIGSRKGKLDFTVIGDAVNMAARLKAQAMKAKKTGIVLAPATIRKTKGWARVNFIDRVMIKGKSREYPIYELLELRSNLN